MRMEFMWYGTRNFKDKSGAYLFLPDGEARAYMSKQTPITRVTEGPLFSEVVTFYRDFQQRICLYNLPGVEGLSLDVSIVVDIHDQVNRELAVRLSTGIESGDMFFTDLNGFQIQTRKFLRKLPLQANFYPMPAMAYIQDNRSRLTVHTAQSLGVSSLHSGQLEIILDRRLMQDDNRGLGQGLKDNKVTCNRFRILLERRTTTSKVQDSRPVSFPSLLSHVTSMLLNHEVLVMTVTPQQQSAPPIRSWHLLSAAIPCDFHLLNIRTLQSEVVSAPGLEAALILHRKGFDCGLEARSLGFNCTTTQGKLSVGSLFQGLDVVNLQPSSLTLLYTAKPVNSSLVFLRPMEIATFRIRMV